MYMARHKILTIDDQCQLDFIYISAVSLPIQETFLRSIFIVKQHDVYGNTLLTYSENTPCCDSRFSLMQNLRVYLSLIYESTNLSLHTSILSSHPILILLEISWSEKVEFFKSFVLCKHQRDEERVSVLSLMCSFSFSLSACILYIFIDQLRQ